MLTNIEHWSLNAHQHRTLESPCVTARATMEAVKAGDTHIRMLIPAVLRQSLRKAGQLMKPCEVAAIFEYVPDEHFEDLHGLYLAHLRTGDVARLSWQGKQEGQTGAKKLFIACNERSSELLELMCFNKAVLLEPPVAWEKLARYPPSHSDSSGVPHLTVVVSSCG